MSENIINIPKKLRSLNGQPLPLGANMDLNGCNFSLFSKNATSVTLHLFEKAQGQEPVHSFSLDPLHNKTGDIWHIFIYDIPENTLYGYTLDSEKEDYKINCFNPQKLILDPYAKAIEGVFDWEDPVNYAFQEEGIDGYHLLEKARHSSRSKEGYKKWSILKDYLLEGTSNLSKAPKGRIFSPRKTYVEGWENDKSPNIPLKDSIIYEVHARGITKDPTSQTTNPGTYSGIIEKIDYFKSLGITTLELLPIHIFNPLEIQRENPVSDKKLIQYWGYSTINFFFPSPWFSSSEDSLSTIKEFKKMVMALHKAKIEVILDVVYNHTAEGNERGPIFSFKGIDNSTYYMINDEGYYMNYSGCGNTLNCNHIVVKNLILDSLRYWVTEMHIDGFRFDLATILGRDQEGHWLSSGSLLNDISQDPILSQTKVIAEGWDAAGLYQVGNFPSRWAEWNGRFRDDVRSFIKSDPYKIKDLCLRMTGSSDIFKKEFKRKPYQSINFITAHDGFTLNDLVSYNEKHNYANGEANRDGSDSNISWNCGVEGITDNKEINSLREKQMKNLLTILLLSQGTPMLLSGDEVAFSKNGNNNTYCHDDDLNWLSWNFKEKENKIFKFTQFLIKTRKKFTSLRKESFSETGSYYHGVKEIQFFDRMGNLREDLENLEYQVGWLIQENNHKRGLKEKHIFIIFNNYWEDVEFTLPYFLQKSIWKKIIDTDNEKGFWEETESPLINTSSLKVKARSIQVLVSNI